MCNLLNGIICNPGFKVFSNVNLLNSVFWRGSYYMLIGNNRQAIEWY